MAHNALTLLYDDADLCFVDKPAGLATVSERWDPEAVPVIDLLWKSWQKRDPDAPRPHVVHRLDKDTTGVLAFARHRDAQAELRRQFRERTVQKSYVALTRGVPDVAAGEIELAIEEDPRQPGRMRVAGRKGKACSTSYETLEVFRGFAWVQLYPRTGRTHQIRISLQQIGTPCVADPIYGDGEALFSSQWIRGYRKGRGREERPLLSRTALHASQLVVTHPTTGELLTIEAPLPKDLSVVLKQLRKWCPI